MKQATNIMSIKYVNSLKENWNDYFEKACELQVQSERYLNKALQRLLMDKKFSNYLISKFSCSFCGGGECVVTFNNEGENADLDIHALEQMTKFEIMDYLEDYISKESKNLFMEERMI